MSKYNIDETRQIAIVWGIIDVQFVRPDLDDKEAMEVLTLAEDKHDANYGITWDILCDYAHSLYPLLDVPVSEQDKNNCARCKFNVSISENKCRKYNPDLSAIKKKGGEAYCRNFEEGASTEAQETALECDKCQKSEGGCSDYEGDANGNCRNFIPRNFNLCNDCRFVIGKKVPCDKYYKGHDGNCRNREAYSIRISIKE